MYATTFRKHSLRFSCFSCLGKRTWRNIENVFRCGGNFHRPGPGSCVQDCFCTNQRKQKFTMKHWYIHQFLLTHIKIHAIRRGEQSRRKRLHDMCKLSTCLKTQHINITNLFPLTCCHDSMKEQNAVVDDCDLKLPQNEEDPAGNHLPHKEHVHFHPWNPSFFTRVFYSFSPQIYTFMGLVVCNTLRGRQFVCSSPGRNFSKARD